MKMLCGKTMQMYLLVTVSVLLYSADAIGLNQDELMEEMFFGEEPLIEELQESGGPELSRNRRQTDVGSGEELITVALNLEGPLSPDQLTEGTVAHTELVTEVENTIQTTLRTEFPDAAFQVKVIRTLAVARRRRKRQANSGGVGLTITEAEISFFTSDDSASILVGVSKVLHDLELGAGLKLFAGQQKEVTCLLQFPEVAKQSETLVAAVCYLCQNYETCSQMTNSSWYCAFQDNRFYFFGVDQGDEIMLTETETKVQLNVQEELPYGNTLYSSIWVSMHGTINFGITGFDSFQPQILPITNFNVMAPYWVHFAHSALGKVYYHLYTSGGLNSAKQQAVLDRARSDVAEFYNKNIDPSVVIVVTWDRMLSYYRDSDDERASFQAAIISDGAETYVTYLYGHGALKIKKRQSTTRLISCGSRNYPQLDTQTSYFQFDTVVGNTDKTGIWFFKIGEVPNSAGKCVRWFINSVRELPIIRWNNNRRISRGCPCSRRQAQRRPMWVPSMFEPNCYELIPRRGVVWGRRCCYRGNALDNRIPIAGSYQKYSAVRSQFAALHFMRDVLPKTWCCEQSHLCNLYYFLRPQSGCVSWNPRRAFMYGDPHMVTLDNKSFTFNNLGEFSLLNVKGTIEETTSVDFKGQARTCQATSASGDLTKATIWCGFALKTTLGTQAQITSLKGQDSHYLVIFVNGRDYTAAFRNATEYEESNDDIVLTKEENGALTVNTEDGVSFTFSLSDEDVLEFSVELTSELTGLTTGLMGNFNDNPEDDFMDPSGTVMAPNATDRQIFEYVKKWAVDGTTSVFTYENGKTFADFTDPAFEPLFLDEVDQARIDEAEVVCGGGNNSACVFDYIATNNTALALRSTSALSEFETELTEDAEVAPTIDGPDSVNVTLGENITVSFNVSHANSASLEVTFEEMEPDQYSIVSNEDGAVVVQYVPQANVDLIKPPTLSVVDQQNMSSLATLGIIQCSGCSNNGQCDYANPREVKSPYISIASCICDPPYSGDDCQNDKDGCEGFPCPERTICTDVPAAEQLTTNKAFTCSDCQPGFVADGDKCADVNECLENTTCPALSTCSNAIGSYSCSCDHGYRKDAAGTCQDIDECIELYHECSQICVNTVGSYRCECRQGFTLDAIVGFNCTKDIVDPCAGTNVTCDYGCEIVNDAPQCFCERGFQLDSDNRTCVDEDECQQGLCAQTCENTIGSYRCGCLPGFTPGANHDCVRCEENKYGEDCKFQCECKGRSTDCNNVRGCMCIDGWTGTNCDIDVNECEIRDNLCPTEQECVNTNGGYTCGCAVGYEVNGENCVDIDECLDVSLHQCPQECTNSPGSFFCNCRDGYRYNSTGNTCDDIDECEMEISACSQDCVNVKGSYSCQCKLGYVLNDDRKTCREEAGDPCSGSNPGCEEGCFLENGNPTCFCKRGYTLMPDNTACMDVDECSGDNQCSDVCSNLLGSFECSCPTGKKLGNDQRTCAVCDPYHWGDDCATQCDCNPKGTIKCDAVEGCKCKIGWSGTTCSDDINECSNSPNPCPAMSTCTNTAGSYICTCDTGYQLSNDRTTCIDIDECEQARCDQTCNNTIGSFVCSCNNGFLLQNDSNCVDIDECQLGTHECDQTCRNLYGSYQCSCDKGYNLNLDDRRGCIDIDECANTLDHICSEYELCTNTPGAHNCSCKPGYERTNDSCTADSESVYSILVFTVRLDIPDASNDILDNTTDAFRVVAAKVSARMLEVGVESAGSAVVAVVVVEFTPGSYIADTRVVFTEPSGSEALGTAAASMAHALTTADMSSIAAGTATLNVDVGDHGVNGTSSTCIAFGTIHQCDAGAGFYCNDTGGIAKCSLDVDECANAPDHDCTNYKLCSNTIGSFNCNCKPGYDVSGDSCLPAAGDSSTIVTFSITLDIPGASDSISDNTTEEFRLMEIKVSSTILTQGQSAIGDSMLSVVIVQFTGDPYVADTRIAVAEAPSSEALAVKVSNLAIALRAADVSAIATNASVVEVGTQQYTLTSNSTACDVFNTLYTCQSGFQCEATGGTTWCSAIPSSDDGDDQALTIWLAVGISAFVLLAIVVAVVVYVCTRRKPAARDGSSLRSSDEASFAAGIGKRWHSGLSLPYSPASFKDSESDAGSTNSGPGPSRGRPRFSAAPKTGEERFEPPWMTRGAGASSFVASPEVEPPKGRPRPNTNSNFSWEYMFGLLEPHMPLEIQRPQVRPTQRDGNGLSSSSNS